MNKTISIPEDIFDLSITGVEETWDAGFAIVCTDSVGKTRYYTGYNDDRDEPIFSYRLEDSLVYTSNRECNRAVQQPDFEHVDRIGIKAIHFIH